MSRPFVASGRYIPPALRRAPERPGSAPPGAATPAAPPPPHPSPPLHPRDGEASYWADVDRAHLPFPVPTVQTQPVVQQPAPVAVSGAPTGLGISGVATEPSSVVAPANGTVASGLASINLNASDAISNGPPRTTGVPRPVAMIDGRFITPPQPLPWYEPYDTTWDERPTYVKSQWTRETFLMGDVIYRPSHVPNKRSSLPHTDPSLSETDCMSHVTLCGRRMNTFVFSKRRIFVVLYSGNGIGAVHQHTWRDHVAVRDSMTRHIVRRNGVNPAVDFVHISNDPRDALTTETTIDLVSGVTVNWEEDAIWPVGRLTKQGYDRLEKYYIAAIQRAQNKATTWPTGGAFDYYYSPQVAADGEPQ